ncbi:MAG: hypothetical protein JSV25_00980 [Spirochaetota bacterium]|nr:MAG: hypothetical protein JSV25_00980 [Spirochaetota bacterium]
MGEGYIEQITISTDRCNKHLLNTYGGGEYKHLSRNDVPLMRHLGMTEEQVNTLLAEKPIRLLPFRR